MHPYGHVVPYIGIGKTSPADFLRSSVPCFHSVHIASHGEIRQCEIRLFQCPAIDRK